MDPERREPKLHPALVELEAMLGDREKYLSYVKEWVRYSWRWSREDKYKLIFRIQATILESLRDFLNSRGFVEVLAPIIGPVTDPGIRGAKQATVDFYGMEYKVMSSAILYKQYMAASLGKIYFLSPNIRLEPNDSVFTGRHLVEFYQLDLEIYGATYLEVMDLAEEMIIHVLRSVRDIHGKDLEDKLGRVLIEPRRPFRRYTHRDAVDLVNKLGCPNPQGAEVRWECEKLLSAYHDNPFFIMEYAKGSRGFYDMEDPSRPGILRDFDLLYPEGFGEAISGAEREYEPTKVLARIREGGEDPNKYRWYLEMLRELYPLRTAGFGIGIERLTRYVCGLRAIWEARPYPKLPGIGPAP